MPDELLRVRGLSKRYVRRAGLFGTGDAVQALQDVDLDVAAGSTLALVGESGSGKSTLARCLACLEQRDAGEIRFDGRELVAVSPSIQLIFQDSAQALNPRLTARESVAEPLLIQRRGSVDSRARRAHELMEAVGLPAALGGRRPFELSGGQRQRLGIARALALEPKLLILDEPFAGLDLVVQAHVVNLLLELQAARQLAYVFVSHDIGLMGRIADEIAVLQQGRVVERGGAAAILAEPQHPHTRALIGAIPALPA
jgi:ABC-type glutathione transport system ATPase component